MTSVLLKVRIRHARLTPGIITAIAHLPGVSAVTRLAPVGTTADDGTVTVAPEVRRKGTGRVRRLPSGRWQARGSTGAPAPHTFTTRAEAVAWLDSINGAPDAA